MHDFDANIPVADVEQLRTALKSASVENEIVRYPDAEHAFHCDERPSYNEPAAKDGWARTFGWFRENLTSS